MKEEEVGGLVVCFSSAAAVRRPGSFANGPLFSLSFPFNSSLLLSSSHLRGGHALNDVARALQDRRHGGEASLLWFRNSRNNGGGREEEGENVSERESQCGKLVKREKPSLFLFLFLSLQLLYSQGTSRSRPETAWKGQGRSFVSPFVF